MLFVAAVILMGAGGGVSDPAYLNLPDLEQENCTFPNLINGGLFEVIVVCLLMGSIYLFKSKAGRGGQRSSFLGLLLSSLALVFTAVRIVIPLYYGELDLCNVREFLGLPWADWFLLGVWFFSAISVLSN